MTVPSHAEGRLEVSRSELAQALKIVARVMGEYSGAVELTFNDGYLSVEADNIPAKAASGDWPLRRSDLEALVSDARASGPASWSPEDRPVMSMVAKAWDLLAPLGIETTDLRRLVELAMRNAWK